MSFPSPSPAFRVGAKVAAARMNVWCEVQRLLGPGQAQHASRLTKTEEQREIHIERESTRALDVLNHHRTASQTSSTN